MDQQTLKRAYRNAWIVLLIAILISVAFFWLALRTNEPPVEPEFEMGNVPFVPASSTYAEGYYLPVEEGSDE